MHYKRNELSKRLVTEFPRLTKTLATFGLKIGKFPLRKAPIESDALFIMPLLHFFCLSEFLMAISRRLLLCAVPASFLTGCGFHLRNSFTLPFETLYLDMESNSRFAATLTRLLRASSNVRLVSDAKDAEAILRITKNTSSRDVISYSTSGRAREFQLKNVITFTVTAPDGSEYLSPTTLTATRDITYDDSDYLSRDSEEAMIKSEMQNDLINQMIRRIERTAKPIAKR